MILKKIMMTEKNYDTEKKKNKIKQNQKIN